MNSKKIVFGLFDDEQVLMKAVKTVRNEGLKISDVLTPFPVHGLDEMMGLRQTKLHSAGFVFGMTGTLTALTFILWVSTANYPLNYGGKPYLSLPAWIPITFELTVLFAMAFEIDPATSENKKKEIETILKASGALEVHEKDWENL